MSDAEFIEAIAANPDDDSLRLVYADWLDEQASPEAAERAEILRLEARLRSEPKHYRKTKEKLHWFYRRNPRTSFWFEGSFGVDVAEMLEALVVIGTPDRRHLAAFLVRAIRETPLQEGRRLPDFFTYPELHVALDFTWRYANGEHYTSTHRQMAYFFEYDDYVTVPPAGLEQLAFEAVSCAANLVHEWYCISVAELAEAVRSLVAELAGLVAQIADAAAERSEARRLHCRLLRECVKLPIAEALPKQK